MVHCHVAMVTCGTCLLPRQVFARFFLKCFFVSTVSFRPRSNSFKCYHEAWYHENSGTTSTPPRSESQVHQTCDSERGGEGTATAQCSLRGARSSRIATIRLYQAPQALTGTGREAAWNWRVLVHRERASQ